MANLPSTAVVSTTANSVTLPESAPVDKSPKITPEPAQSTQTQDELERVRELILGSDAQRMGKAEADRLREIIFGSHMQEYDRRFTDMRREMERVLADLRQGQDNAVEFERTQVKRAETFEQEAHQNYDDLRREVQRLRAQDITLQQLITQVRQLEILNQSLVARTEELNKIITQQERDLRAIKATVNENRDQHERKVDALKREVRLGVDDLRVELRRLVDRLDDQKTDRKALASMLIEVATRLETGSSVTGLLKELPVPSRE
jgi:hypothetical protein